MNLKVFFPDWEVIRSYYTGLGKSAVIMPASLAVSLGSGMNSLGMVFYLKDILGATPADIGWITASWSAAYFLGCLLLRPLFSNLLPRHLLIIATTGRGTCLAAALLSHSLPWAALFCALDNLCLALFWPPIMGWLSAGKEGSSLSRAMGRFNLSWSLGSILSPYLAGHLTERSRDFPILAAIALFFLTSLAILIACLTLPRLREDQKQEVEYQEESSSPDNSTPLRFPSWVGSLTAFVFIGALLNIFPLYARDELGASPGFVGLLLLTRSLFSTLGFMIWSRIAFWHFRPSYILASQALLAVFLIVLSGVRTLSFHFILLALLGSIISLIYSISLFHGVAGSPHRQARMALHEAILAVGQILGAAAGGYIYQHGTMAGVFRFCFLFVLSGGMIQLWLIHRAGRALPKKCPSGRPSPP